MVTVTIGPVVSDEKLFESVDGRRRRATEPAYLISSPGAFGSFKLKHQASFPLNALNEYLFVLKKPGARFTKHLKPKIFVSSIQTVWNLRKS